MYSSISSLVFPHIHDRCGEARSKRQQQPLAMIFLSFIFFGVERMKDASRREVGDRQRTSKHLHWRIHFCITLCRLPIGDDLILQAVER